MNTNDGYLNRIRTAAAEREFAQFVLEQAKADLREQIRCALALGASASDLAAATGLPLSEIQKLGHTGP